MREMSPKRKAFMATEYALNTLASGLPECMGDATGYLLEKYSTPSGQPTVFMVEEVGRVVRGEATAEESLRLRVELLALVAVLQM